MKKHAFGYCISIEKKKISINRIKTAAPAAATASLVVALDCELF